MTRSRTVRTIGTGAASKHKPAFQTNSAPANECDFGSGSFSEKGPDLGGWTEGEKSLSVSASTCLRCHCSRRDKIDVSRAKGSTSGMQPFLFRNRSTQRLLSHVHVYMIPAAAPVGAPGDVTVSLNTWSMPQRSNQRRTATRRLDKHSLLSDALNYVCSREGALDPHPFLQRRIALVKSSRHTRGRRITATTR
jgi:hypothetical protein